PLNDGLKIDVGKILAEEAADGGADKFASDGVGALEFTLVFEFELAGDGRKRSVDVGDSCDGGVFSRACRALLAAADDAFENGEWQALGDAGALVDAVVVAGLEGNFFDELAEISGDVDGAAGIAGDPGFLLGDGHAFGDGGWIVRANFSADAVLERS